MNQPFQRRSFCQCGCNQRTCATTSTRYICGQVLLSAAQFARGRLPLVLSIGVNMQLTSLQQLALLAACVAGTRRCYQGLYYWKTSDCGSSFHQNARPTARSHGWCSRLGASTEAAQSPRPYHGRQPKRRWRTLGSVHPNRRMVEATVVTNTCVGMKLNPNKATSEVRLIWHRVVHSADTVLHIVHDPVTHLASQTHRARPTYLARQTHRANWIHSQDRVKSHA
jgi:hypothetical protein